MLEDFSQPYRSSMSPLDDEWIPTPEFVMLMHAWGIAIAGGSGGVRSVDLLQSAIAAPFAGFAGQSVVPTMPARAVSLLTHIADDHPFIDGNKRCALLTSLQYIAHNGLGTAMTARELADITLAIASHDRHKVGGMLPSERLLATIGVPLFVYASNHDDSYDPYPDHDESVKNHTESAKSSSSNWMKRVVDELDNPWWKSLSLDGIERIVTESVTSREQADGIIEGLGAICVNGRDMRLTIGVMADSTTLDALDLLAEGDAKV